MSAPDFGGDLAGADGATVRAALAHAEFPALLPALAALVGDPSSVPDHLQPDATNIMDPTGGLSPAQLAEAEELAFGALCRLREVQAEAGAAAVPDLDVDELRHLLGYVAGGAPVGDYLEKDHDVDGTWFENTYPGCRVDVANLFYSYSFARRNDWPDHFSPGRSCSTTSAPRPTGWACARSSASTPRSPPSSSTRRR